MKGYRWHRWFDYSIFWCFSNVLRDSLTGDLRKPDDTFFGVEQGEHLRMWGCSFLGLALLGPLGSREDRFQADDISDCGFSAVKWRVPQNVPAVGKGKMSPTPVVCWLFLFDPKEAE